MALPICRARIQHLLQGQPPLAAQPILPDPRLPSSSITRNGMPSWVFRFADQHDVRVPQGGDDPGLIQEALQDLAVGGGLWVQQLDGAQPPGAQVAPLVDRAHPPSARSSSSL